MKKLFLVLLTISLAFAFSAEAQIVDEAPIDGLYANTEMAEKVPVPYANIRQADVMWSKRVWREIDFRQKFNREATSEEYIEALESHLIPHRKQGTWPDMSEEIWELAFKDWEKKTGRDRSELNFDP